MVYSNPNEMDAAFVRNVIAQHSLDPSPKHGFHASPLYWQQSIEWRRCIEEYDWGSVVFLSDLKRGQHFTVVILGQFDATTGKLKQSTSSVGHLSKIVPWYLDLVAGLSEAQQPSNVDIPPCLGFNEPDHVCIGGVNPTTKLTEPACAWLSRCSALRMVAEATNRNQQDMLKSKSPEQIVQLTERLLAQKTAKQTPKTKAKAVPVTLKVEHTSGRFPDAVKQVATIMVEVAKLCDVGVAHDANSASPGELYMIDRTTKSDYVTVYQSIAAGAKRRPLASWRIRTRDPGFRVQLPMLKEDPLLQSIVKADIVVWNDGAFKCCVNDVIPGQLRMDNIRAIMCHLAKAPR